MALPILITGPTASGKSAMAIEVAQTTDGIVINADLMQCYAEWRILTARPSPQDEATAPHALYGVVSVREVFSVGRWLRAMAKTLDTCRREGKRPIICGGSGLCFNALTRGLSDIPDIPPQVRTQGEARLAGIGLPAFFSDYAARAPESAALIDRENPRRVLRAWEVLEATGRSIAEWNAETGPPLLPDFHAVVLNIAPARLRDRIARRFDMMMDMGAMDEVAAVMAMDLPSDHPSMKAHGAPHLMAHLRGKMTMRNAVERSKIDTNQYAKRQRTWFRNQAPHWARVDPLDRAAVRAIIAGL